MAGQSDMNWRARSNGRSESIMGCPLAPPQGPGHGCAIQCVSCAIFGGVAFLSDLWRADGHMPTVPGSGGGVCRQRRLLRAGSCTLRRASQRADVTVPIQGSGHIISGISGNLLLTKTGERGGIRTPDPMIKSHVL